MTFTLSAVGGEVIPVAPGGVVDLTATPRDAAAHLTWSAPATSGSAPVTGYQVTATAGGMVRRYTATSTATSLDLGQLVNGITWTISVTSTTSVGPGPAVTATVTPVETAGAAEAPAQPAVTLPGAPTLLALESGATGAVATWSAPVDNGGSPITAYHFVAVAADGSTETVYAPTTAPLTAVLYPLTNEQAYTVTVAAVNAAGEGAASNSLVANPTASGPDVGPAPTDPGTVYVPAPQPTLWAFPATYPLAPAFFLATPEQADVILAGSSVEGVAQ